MFKLIDKTIGLRVSPEEELEGLDYVEHGGNAYPDFEVSSYGGTGFPPPAPQAVPKNVFDGIGIVTKSRPIEQT
jgi:Amt family ammonium transporter